MLVLVQLALVMMPLVLVLLLLKLMHLLNCYCYWAAATAKIVGIWSTHTIVEQTEALTEILTRAQSGHMKF